ncbi:hypothetical protein FGG78_20135 [Thioclava sp. BHET1]|nr:hypothetical protein FGG78_20135 [Thioclava sp. BHET1]
MAAPALRAVAPTDLASIPDYPIERSTRLTAHYFMMWWHDRWLNSTMHLKASYEVQGVAVALFSIAQRQTPIGTLPDDDEMLAKLLRMDLARWRDLVSLPVSPLHNWSRCNCEGEIRLMHPVVLEVAMDAITRRDVREAKASERAVAKRSERLRLALSEMGCDRAVIGDEVLIERMDKWLLESCHGNRTRLVYERALEHAARMGWFNAGANRLS